MNTKIELDSGAKLEITMLGFRDGKDLYNAVATELKDINVNFLSIGSLSDMDISILKDAILQITTSHNLVEALKPALAKATYDNKKINDDLFDDPDIRSDYFIVCWEVIKYNILPFLPKNVLKLFEGIAKNTISPEQK